MEWKAKSTLKTNCGVKCSSPLNDKALFAELFLDEELETIVWPNGADFAPEFLYQQLCPNYTLKPPPKSGADA